MPDSNADRQYPTTCTMPQIMIGEPETYAKEEVMGLLDEKVAIITGAGRRRSIGYSTALALAEMGSDVVVTGTGRDPATFPPDEKAIGWRDIELTAEHVRAKGRRALPIVADVTSVDAVEMMMERTLEEFGRVDILINNAAMPIGKDRVPIVDLDPDLFQQVLDVKARGTYLCSA